MQIPDDVRGNFEELRRAFKNGDVALLSCTHRVTGRPVYAICAVNVDYDADGQVVYGFIPFGSLDSGLANYVEDPSESHHSMGDDA